MVTAGSTHKSKAEVGLLHQGHATGGQKPFWETKSAKTAGKALGIRGQYIGQTLHHSCQYVGEELPTHT